MNAQPTVTEPDDDALESWSGDRLPPPSSFFPSTAYDEVLERVHRLVEGAKEVALLTGPDGAGKTTLLFRIQSDTPEHWLPCRVDANPMMHPDQLFTKLARCLDMPRDEEETSESVAAAFGKLRMQGVLPVVMVDDAEQLPISTMVALLRLHERRAADNPVCALFLLARPEIESALSTQQLHAMGTARFVRIQLPRLGLEEIPKYVRHFLHMEGVEQELGFDTRQLVDLYKESEGLPGRLNELVVGSLRDAVIPRKETLPVQLLRRLRSLPPITALASGALIFLLLLTLLFQSQLESLFLSEQTTTETDSVSNETDEPEQPQEEINGKRLKPLLIPPMAERLDAELESETPTVTVRERPQIKEFRPEIIPLPMEPETPVSNQASVAEVAEEEPVPKPPKQEPPEPTPEPDVSNALVFQREEWLLKQRPESYSLQILAAGNEQAVRRFAKKHGLTTDIYYFKSKRNERPWIVLLLGVYEDRRTAVTVLNMLPETLREAGAWPRSLRSIQEEIRQAR